MTIANKDVAKGFINGLALKGSNLYSTIEGKLFSYNTCIAQKYNGDIIGNSTKYSSTSSRHLGYIKNYITLWTTSNTSIPFGTTDLLSYL